MGSALGFAVRRDTYDWSTLGVAVLVALATAAAAFVALYGPRWNEKRKSPRLRLEAEPEWTGNFVGEDAQAIPDGYHLTIVNMKGRATAREVEVRLDVAFFDDQVSADFGEPLPIPLVADARLNFRGNDGSPGRTAASVNPGAQRRVYLLRLGHPAAIRRSWIATTRGNLPEGDLNRFVGAWATTPATRDELLWVGDSEDFEIVLTLMGDNFDATAFSGRLRVERYEMPELGVFADVKWSRPLSEVPFDATFAA